MSVRPSARLRFLLGCASVPVVAAMGVDVAMRIPIANAGLIPTLPTVTLPLPTVTLPPPTLPVSTTARTTTTGTSTGPTSTSTSGGGVTTPATTVSLPRANAGISGALRLPSGVLSIPISSVTAPAQLGIARITFSPNRIGVRGQRIRLVVRVTDSRGYRVRGAAVDVRGIPAAMLARPKARTSGNDGTATLQLKTTSRLPMRAGFALVLVVRAYERGKASGNNVAHRVVSLRVKPR